MRWGPPGQQDWTNRTSDWACELTEDRHLTHRKGQEVEGQTSEQVLQENQTPCWMIQKSTIKTLEIKSSDFFPVDKWEDYWDHYI